MFQQRPLIRLGLLLLLVAVISAGCNGAPQSSAETGGAALTTERDGQGTVTVRIKDFAFHPEAITVAPGTRLLFVNDDPTPHNVVEGSAKGSHVQESPAAFRLRGDRPRRKVELVLDEEGEYAFACTVGGHHLMGMTGTIRVAEGAAAPESAPVETAAEETRRDPAHPAPGRTGAPEGREALARRPGRAGAVPGRRECERVHHRHPGSHPRAGRRRRGDGLGLQRRRARPLAPGRRGRHRPGALHEQPPPAPHHPLARDLRRPGARRRPSHQRGRDAGGDARLRVGGRTPRDVPLPLPRGQLPPHRHGHVRGASSSIPRKERRGSRSTRSSSTTGTARSSLWPPGTSRSQTTSSSTAEPSPTSRHCR